MQENPLKFTAKKEKKLEGGATDNELGAAMNALFFKTSEFALTFKFGR